MNKKTIIFALASLIVSSSSFNAWGDGTSKIYTDVPVKEFREALRLRDAGLKSRSSVLFDDITRKVRHADAEGYSLLNDVMMNVPGYQGRMEDFIASAHQSVLKPQIFIL